MSLSTNHMADKNIIATGTTDIAPDGTWQIEVPPNVPAGLHKVVVEDDMGNQDDALLYVERSMIDRMTNVMPPVFGLSFLFFLVVIVLLAANNIRLGRIADQNEAIKKKRKYLRHAMYFSAFMVALSLIVGLTLNWGTSIFEKTMNYLSPGKGYVAKNVSGALIDSKGMPVSGATLAVGDTMIVTADSGMYAFPMVATEEGILISHPSVKRAINKEVRDSGKLDIIFDPGLMQSLVEVAELEARGDKRNLYKQVTLDKIKSTYTQDQYVNSYKANFTPSDLSSGPIYVGSIAKSDNYKSVITGEVFPQVVNIEVFTTNGIANYSFLEEQGKWKLVF